MPADRIIREAARGGARRRAPGARLRRRRDGRRGRRRGHPARGGGRGRAVEEPAGADVRRADAHVPASRARRNDHDAGAATDPPRRHRSRPVAAAAGDGCWRWACSWSGCSAGRSAGHGHPGARRRRPDRLPRVAQRHPGRVRRSRAPARFFFEYIIGGISAAIDATVTGLRDLISQPSFPRPVPEIGWLGVVAIFTWLAYALAGWRSAVLVLVGLLLFGFLGYWQEAIDTLIVTLRGGAGVRDHRDPAGRLDGRSRRVAAVITPVLDVDADHAVLRLPGPAGAVLRHRPGLGRGRHADLRGAAVDPDHRARHPHGVPDDLEAARSMGASRWQPLRKVQLPMARRTIIVGINQTHHGRAVDGHHRGADQRPRPRPAGGPGAADASTSATPSSRGIAIVIMAIMLDRVTTAAASDGPRRPRAAAARAPRAAPDRCWSRAAVVAAGLRLPVATPTCWAAVPGASPTSARRWRSRGHRRRHRLGCERNLSGFTDGDHRRRQHGLLNPLQSLLADSPWWLIVRWPCSRSPACSAAGGPVIPRRLPGALILGTGLWNDAHDHARRHPRRDGHRGDRSALVVGVWMGRSRRPTG